MKIKYILIFVFFANTIKAQLSVVDGVYQITSAADLVYLSNHSELWTKGHSFLLTQDINMIAVANFSPIGNTGTMFEGVFDGGNHKISNLKVTQSTNGGDTYAGLFGRIGSYNTYNQPYAVVRNVIISNANLTAKWSGGIAGWVAYPSIIENCRVENSTIVGGYVAGGIIGTMNSVRTNSQTDPSGYMSAYLKDNVAIACTIKGDNIYTGFVGDLVGLYDPGSKSIIQEVITGNQYGGNSLSGAANVNPAIGNGGSQNGGMDLPEAESEGVGNIHILDIIVGRWNLVGTYIKNAKLSILGDNFTLNHGEHDMAVVGFDYANNNWDGDYLYAKDEMKLGEGYFVWPYPSSRPDTNNNGAITNYNDVGQYLYWMQGGNVNTDDVTVTKTNTAEENTSGGIAQALWFSFANPFSTTLTWSEIQGDNIQGSSGYVYVYDADGGAWEYETSFEMSRGFMLAPTSGRTLSITMSKSSAKKSMKEEKRNPITFSVSTNKHTRKAKAYIDVNANNRFDKKDTYAMLNDRKGFVEPYFFVNHRQIVENFISTLPYETEIRFHSVEYSPVCLSVQNIPDSIVVSIINEQSEREVILNDEEYHFVVAPGENEGKYKIRFSKIDVGLEQVQEKETDISIWNERNVVYLSGEGMKSVEVVNALGQKVYSSNVNGNYKSLTLGKELGFYVVKVKTRDSVISQKILVD